MLTIETTWGDLRRIRAESSYLPLVDNPDDILRLPEVTQLAIGKSDDEAYYVSVVATEGFEFFLVDDPDSDIVPMLIRTNYEAGAMELRINGAWVVVRPDDDFEELDMPYHEVSEGAVMIWDRATTKLRLLDFQAAYLDGV